MKGQSPDQTSGVVVEEIRWCCRAFAIRDNYPFWKSRNERSHAGKLFFLDPRDNGTLKIFFDDNIGHTAAHIVDVRDVHTGKLVPFQV